MDATPIYISPYAKRTQSLGVEWQNLNGGGKRADHGATYKPSPAKAAPVWRQHRKPTTFRPLGLPMTQSTENRRAHGLGAHTSASLNTKRMPELVALRKALKNDPGKGTVHPSYNDLLAKIVAQALLEHPMLNARIEADEVIQLPSVHIAIAVDTERGLIVPVLRDVQNKTLRQIARESAVLIEKTRNGTIRYEDLQGPLFDYQPGHVRD
jgi:pyruvate/2-oxoglutarate dehydrogenase complex dihydrolipoamide acyltransferase (E2) component